MSIRQSDGTFDGKNIVLWATALDTERPGRKTVARAHLEENGRLLLHRHFLIDDKGNERMMIELLNDAQVIRAQRKITATSAKISGESARGSKGR
jgi:hypothetical protein